MAAATENGTATSPEHLQKEPAKLQVLHVYQHSNFFYWWVVWAYGFLCALLTYFNGRTVNLFAEKQLYVHSSAWVGISFVALLLIVIFFTNYRVKGANSFIMILGIALLALFMAYMGWWGPVFNILPSLLIYMNLAFYVSVSTVLLGLWVLATLILDHLTYWEFT